MGIRCADHVTPLYPQKLALTLPTGGGRSVGIVRSRTEATEFGVSMQTGSNTLAGCFPIPYCVEAWASVSHSTKSSVQCSVLTEKNYTPARVLNPQVMTPNNLFPWTLGAHKRIKTSLGVQ